MPYRDLEPVSRQLTIVVGLTVVGFMAFGLALSFYRNTLFDVTLQNIRVENSKLRKANARSLEDLEYYRSAQYKDKYAKENMGMVRAGERVMLLREQKPDVRLNEQGKEDLTEQQQLAFEELLRQMPVLEHWRLFLFHRERIDELKKGM